jgi:exonuclease III
MNTQNNIMVWNCRGAASSAFYRYCKQYVNNWRPVMLVVMETRCNPDKLKRTFNLLGYDGFLAAENSGFSGGIIVGWKGDSLIVNLELKKFQYLHLKVSYPRGRDWYFTAIYASPNEINRASLIME